MVIAIFPFKYYYLLPDSTLTTKIREESWKLDEIFPLYRQTKSELKRLRKSIKSNLGDLLKLRHTIVLLATEIKTVFKKLKLINFYDSAILYLYFRLLHHVFRLCEKEEARLIAEKEKALSNNIKIKNQKLEDIKKAKETVDKKIKDYEKVINGLDFAEKELIKAGSHLLNQLRKLRWKAEKRAQHEFSFEELTFRSMENINRKIKVEAIKVKKIIPKKTVLMKGIERQGIKPDDVVSLVKLISESIDRISKDVSYSSKLIAQFQDEMAILKKIVENLKKTINNLIKDEERRERIIKNVIKPFDDSIKFVEEEINKDLMQIFRNIFVLYKYIGTRPIRKAA